MCFVSVLYCFIGAVTLRVDAVGAEGSGESSAVSVQAVSLAVVKALIESMEPCCPAAQTPNPILTLAAFNISYHINTCCLEVLQHHIHVISLIQMRHVGRRITDVSFDPKLFLFSAEHKVIT